MAWKSNFQARRTWDPDTGWELFDVTTGPGYPTFELRKNGGAGVRFQGEPLSSTKTGERTAVGHPMNDRGFRVFFLNGRPMDVPPETRHLVQDALYAFGTFHNGPNGPVEVIFTT